ncbi:hypothetical protein EV122DRAFT_284921 [Schizophyllum commune]
MSSFYSSHLLFPLFLFLRSCYDLSSIWPYPTPPPHPRENPLPFAREPAAVYYRRLPYWRHARRRPYRDTRVVGLTATSSTSFRPHRHPSDRTDHTRDDSDDGCDDARDHTRDGCDDGCDNARDPTDAADDACCLADARTT